MRNPRRGKSKKGYSCKCWSESHLSITIDHHVSCGDRAALLPHWPGLFLFLFYPSVCTAVWAMSTAVQL